MFCFGACAAISSSLSSSNNDSVCVTVSQGAQVCPEGCGLSSLPSHRRRCSSGGPGRILASPASSHVRGISHSGQRNIVVPPRTLQRLNNALLIFFMVVHYMSSDNRVFRNMYCAIAPGAWRLRSVVNKLDRETNDFGRNGTV
jgi:hypothetical protein